MALFLFLWPPKRCPSIRKLLVNRATSSKYANLFISEALRHSSEVKLSFSFYICGDGRERLSASSLAEILQTARNKAEIARYCVLNIRAQSNFSWNNGKIPSGFYGFQIKLLNRGLKLGSFPKLLNDWKKGLQSLTQNHKYISVGELD